jgi:2-keto-4-pentenoate hydratase/2-oxohepta-3-ene-1,7-dioic acid hydratase in catechol pathway
MKLCRYGAPGHEKPGIVDSEGRLHDLSAHLADFTPEELAAERLAGIARLDIDGLPLVEGSPRLAPPLARVSKFIAIGLNYRDHAEEAGLAIPTEPIIFMKATSCITGPNDAIIQPPHSTKLDWELELGVVIGKTARYVDEAHALAHVAGYCIVNDVSERAFQMQSSQWDKGKGCDSFGPIGPWLVTRDEVPDPQKLDMTLAVNGQRRQSGNTATMIFSVARIVAYCSRYMTLVPGDVITTGTPPGVGMGMKPPQWLKPGDELHLTIEGLGEQRQKVVTETAGRR